MLPDQDSDTYWRVPPPARAALEAMLAEEAPEQAQSTQPDHAPPTTPEKAAAAPEPHQAASAAAAGPERAPVVDLSWGVLRDAPLEGAHGGPLCMGSRRVPLSGASRAALLALLQV